MREAVAGDRGAPRAAPASRTDDQQVAVPLRDRDRRLQRLLRTTLHHLDADAVSPRATALLAAVARAFLPWRSFPNPPGAAAAPGCGGGPSAPPPEAGEALLPDLIALFTALAAASPPGTVPLTPPVEPWQVRYEGRFRRHGRPATGVWTAETVGCPACGGQAARGR